MFKTYHYTKHESDLIYYTHNTGHERYELFVNGHLVDYIDGTFGTYHLDHNQYSLEVATKVTKSKHVFKIDGVETPLIAVTKKKLKEILAYQGVNSNVNPTAEQIEERRFKPRDFLVPGLLILAGLAIQYFVRVHPGPFQISVLIPEAIAGWLLFDIFAKRYTSLHKIRRGRLGFIVFTIIGTSVFGELLFGLF